MAGTGRFSALTLHGFSLASCHGCSCSHEDDCMLPTHRRAYLTKTELRSQRGKGDSDVLMGGGAEQLIDLK